MSETLRWIKIEDWHRCSASKGRENHDEGGTGFPNVFN